MAMPKVLVIIIATLLLCSMIFIEAANAEFIQYETITKGDEPTCTGSSCLPPPSNPYRRGCEEIQQCRGGSGAENNNEDLENKELRTKQMGLEINSPSPNSPNGP
nr:protein ralf-like 9 [Quercus suber]